MSSGIQPSRFINYISEWKKILVTRNNGPIQQKFKIDSNITDDYYFSIVNNRNQIVSLTDRTFRLYGSIIDAQDVMHVLFYSENPDIQNDVMHFNINTFTSLYMAQIKTNKIIDLTIVEIITPALGELGEDITQVVLRDQALAYKRPYIENQVPALIFERVILTTNVPLTGCFGSGQDINLTLGSNGSAFGTGLTQTGNNQMVIGQYNEPDATKVFIVGNGSNEYDLRNVFTIDYEGNAYTNGYRLLNNSDRTNISELNNDIGYITLVDVPAYNAGTGLRLNNNTFSLTGTVLSGGNLIAISNNKINFTGTIPSGTALLVNTANFITSADVPVYTGANGIGIDSNNVISITGQVGKIYTAGAGIGISNQDVISLTAHIPTKTSELQNDSHFITANEIPSGSGIYFAGFGLELNNSTFNLTGSVLSGDGLTIAINDNIISYIGQSGSEYTAGDGIGISELNVISLTAEIPSAVSQLTNDSGYITSSLIPTSYVQQSDLANYAQTSAIPTSASQLINDGVYINQLIGANGVTVERSGFLEPYGREWFIRGKYVDIVASSGLSSYVYDDAGEKTLYLGIDNSVMTGFAATSAIPTSTSQLTNNNGFINCISAYDAENDQYVTGTVLHPYPEDILKCYSDGADQPINIVWRGVKHNGGTENLEDAIDEAITWDSEDFTVNEGDGYVEVSLANSIPTSTSQLTNNSNFISSIVINCWRDGQGAALSTDAIGIGPLFTYDTGYDLIRINYGIVNGRLVEQGFVTNDALTAYAQISAIPTGLSQLTNDSNFINTLSSSDESIVITINGTSANLSVNQLKFPTFTGLEQYVSTYCAPLSAIPTGLSQLTNDNHYVQNTNMWSSNNSISIERWDDGGVQLNVSDSWVNDFLPGNQEKMKLDTIVQNSGFVLGYDKNYDIFVNTIETNSGILNINQVSGVESIPNNKTATFEQWIKPEGELTGITFASGLNFIGDLPTSFTTGFTQVFTRRLIKNIDGVCKQQISYAYEFENTIQYENIPLTFEAVDDPVVIQFANENPNDRVTLYYKKNTESDWTGLMVNLDIGLGPGESIAFSGDNWTGINNLTDSDYHFTAPRGSGKLKVYGNIHSLLTGNFVNLTDLRNVIGNTKCIFKNLFKDNQKIYDVSNLILPAVAVDEHGYLSMFEGCSNLLNVPKLSAMTLGQYCYDSMFKNCTSLVKAQTILPATDLSATRQYQNMFEGCTSLIVAPLLPATTIYSFSYGSMFKNCTSLLRAPKMAWTSCNSYPNNNMFYGCTNLNYIEVDFTSWFETANNNWVVGVASTGTFVKPSSLAELYGDSKIPSGWTVVNK